MENIGRISLIKMAFNSEDFLHQNNILKYIEFEDEESLNHYTPYMRIVIKFISDYYGSRVAGTISQKEKDEGGRPAFYLIVSSSYEFIRSDCDGIDDFLKGDITVYGSINISGEWDDDGESETCEISAYFKSNELNCVIIFDHTDDTEIILMDNGVSK